ncbi:MAG: sugar ABC transporter permease [Oscillospiraceae bacterium]|nr:sugar ABC transporter permease [Oscillospiraceae bacterium]
MGFGNIVAGQFIKGLMFFAIEVGFFYIMGTPIFVDAPSMTPHTGIEWIQLLPSLGDRVDGEIWNEDDFIYETVFGDRSQQILLYGVVFICICLAFIVIWRASVRSGYEAISNRRAGKKVLSFWGDIKALFDEKIHKLLMILPFMALIVFTVVPLVYMICMAFTNYSYSDSVPSTLNHFDWVGFDTFKQLFASGSALAEQFWSVLAWTLTWAFFATFLNFFLGTFVAIIINRPTTKLKGLWRTIMSITIAVPQFVSLLIIAKMFSDEGIIDKMLYNYGFVDESVRFMSKPVNAKVFVILINLWVGIPYTIMQVTGILKNIPADLYEAARIDGANAVQQFMNITLPYMIFVLTPYIITSFTGNINNFNVIFLLTGGGPPNMEVVSSAPAGHTDLLVTWLYNLSMQAQPKYNIAAVIGIFTFIVLAVLSLVTYRSSGSYKDEEGFK